MEDDASHEHAIVVFLFALFDRARTRLYLLRVCPPLSFTTGIINLSSDGVPMCHRAACDNGTGSEGLDATSGPNISHQTPVEERAPLRGMRLRRGGNDPRPLKIPTRFIGFTSAFFLHPLSASLLEHGSVSGGSSLPWLHRMGGRKRDKELAGKKI